MNKVKSKSIIFCSLKQSIFPYCIIPLIPFFEARGYNVTLIHGNSMLHNNISVESKEITMIDINKYGIKKLIKLLKTNNPCIFISIGYKSLYDILLLRISKSLGIKSLYLEHGLFVPGIGNRYHFQLKDSIRRYLRLSFLYLKFLASSKINIVEELFVLSLSFIKQDYSRNIHDFGLFYTPYGYNLVSKYLTFPSEKLFYSGYPFSENRNKIMKVCSCNLENKVVFIHQPLIKDGLSKITYEQECELINQVGEIFRNFNMELYLKVHPREDLTKYSHLYKNTKIKVTDQPLNEIIYNSKFVIGQFSTAMFHAVKSRIQILIVPYPDLPIECYKIFSEIGLFNPGKEEIESMICNYESIKNNINEKYSKFIEKYVGEYNSFEEQAESILKIIQL